MNTKDEDPGASFKWVESVWKMNSAKIYKLCELKCDSAEDAKDLFQTVALKFCQNANKLQDKSYTYSWMLCVLRNAHYDMVAEKHNTYPMSQMQDYVKSATTLSEDKSVFYQGESPEIDCDRLMSVLKPLDRMIVEMSYIGGFSSEELCPILGISANAVRKHKHFAIAKLREKLFLNE